MSKYIVSACLLGNNCKYNGGNNKNEKLINFLKDKECILVCPEVSGGLTTPRDPSEIISISPLKVMNIKGRDVTSNFINGAGIELDKIKNEDIVCAILKEKSPSCGVHYRYDGTFSSKLIEGSGLFTYMLKEKGIKVYSEDTFIKEVVENDSIKELM